MFIFNIDKKLKKLGFIKIDEDQFFICYRRECKEFGFTHAVNLLHKQNIDNIIQSFDIADGHVVGLTAEEAKLFAAKMIRKWGKN